MVDGRKRSGWQKVLRDRRDCVMKKMAIGMIFIALFLTGCSSEAPSEVNSQESNQITEQKTEVSTEISKDVEEQTKNEVDEATKPDGEKVVEEKEEKTDVEGENYTEAMVGINYEDTNSDSEKQGDETESNMEKEASESVDYSKLSLFEIKAGIPLNKIEFRNEGKFVGGTITDGQKLKNIKWGNWKDFERIAFEMSGDSKSMPHYEVIMPENHGVIVILWSGVRENNAKIPNLKYSKIVKSMDKIYPEDDSMIGVGISLSESKEIRVFQLKNPNRLVIDIKK